MLTKVMKQLSMTALLNSVCGGADGRQVESSFLWQIMRKYGKLDKTDSPLEREEKNVAPVDIIDAIKVNRA